METLDIKQVYYQAYLNKTKILKENEVSMFSIKDRLEYDLFFYSLWHSDILKDLGFEYSNLNLNFIEKSERPDFILKLDNINVGIEIKNKTLHKNIASRVNQKINEGISYEDLVKFIQKEDKEKLINKIYTNENNKPTGFMTNTLNLDTSIEEYIDFIDKKIKNAFTYNKIDSLFLVINLKDESHAFNLLKNISFKFKKFIYYENIEHSKLILKIY